mmetsp:Transcript_57923/g.176458  ORF Transcript_57923/g.176458 Transcript_57923/m.176458 type:complete len:285 (-) Transcript_57923:472-1326(-)
MSCASRDTPMTLTLSPSPPPATLYASTCGFGKALFAQGLPRGQPRVQQMTLSVCVELIFWMTTRKSMGAVKMPQGAPGPVKVKPVVTKGFSRKKLSSSACGADARSSGIRDRPSKFFILRGLARATSMNVPMTSSVETGTSTTRPCATPGPAMTSGTRMEGSQGVLFPQTLWSPNCSPWSDETTTSVLSNSPRVSSVLSRRPKSASRFSISAAYCLRMISCFHLGSCLLLRETLKLCVSMDWFIASVMMKGGCGPGKDICMAQGLPGGARSNNSCACAVTKLSM